MNDLRGLIAKWRKDADDCPVPANNEDRGYSNALYDCADDLTAALSAAQPEGGEAIGFVSAWVVESLREGCAATTTITADRAWAEDAPLYTHPAPAQQAVTDEIVADARRFRALAEHKCGVSFTGFLVQVRPEGKDAEWQFDYFNSPHPDCKHRIFANPLEALRSCTDALTSTATKAAEGAK